MLTELRIENFAIIDRLELEFGPGLITFTGETGAGKSIIMDALEMLLGGRAESGVIRAQAERAVVEGVFKLSGLTRQAVNEILKREDLLDDENYVTLTREVRREGRSTARINGSTVNVGLLREVGALLVDIHGQTEHLSLLDTRSHLTLLDRYAGTDTLLNAYRQTYQALQSVRRELGELRAAQSDAARRIEMYTFQVEEIEAARLKPGEDEELRKERDRLANAETLAANAQEAILLLDEGTPDTPAISDQLGQVVSALASLARVDSSKAELAARAEALLENLADVAHELRDYLETIEYNPKRLEQVEDRLDLIHRLMRKYGGSIEAVLAFGANARKQLENITGAAEKIQELEAREAVLLNELATRGEKLSEQRKKAAEKLAKSIEKELDDLKMAAARFSVDFQTRPDPAGLPVTGGRVAFDATGFDRVEFLVAPNPGEGLKPLAKIASGGETSRLMLALKNVLAKADPVPSLVFDEIDQGIGGRVGSVVGHKLWQLGRVHQVLCITHLPQLAAFGDQHFQVQKVFRNGRTTTQVRHLDGDERLLELAGMLGEVSEGTLRSASDLLQSARAISSG
ncbi:MAG: DNA repair protein RecN [Anaerolineales bacterium]|nr:DNA repair protein RecN [Anaerolineales bacterium]MDW8276839.1 DNA repair protein RecN [Anaerolineales bacterium]